MCFWGIMNVQMTSVCNWAVFTLQEGLKGFYRGWAANALKVIPQNSIRFAAYEALRSLFNV